ncbi:toll-like receptor 7 isoform X2 [Chrysoperla carnea]|uniref:toll-like receptor 7 isoform X2 n=1 Tax=Chrysoperla carnea TaxID=189513 RepID=UPI001D09163C|nr:toll-like receptor 7 isoform X2 [Chrysoperla carnea]
MESFKIGLCLIISIVIVINATEQQPRPENLTADQCSWSPDGNDTSRTAVACHLRKLDGEFGALPSEVTSKLRIKCNEMLLFESSITSRAFQKLHQLSELFIDSCKLLHIPNDSFDGLRELKKLTVNTYNIEWSSNKYLELATGSLIGLRELQHLDLSYNNIRALPGDVFCPLENMQILNLTRNRIRNVDRLGLGNEPRTFCGGAELQALDLSFNELHAVPEGSALTRLRRLQHLNLSHNNITEVSGEALAGLVSLRILDLSSNRLETLPQGLFAGSRELREVHLQNNSLFSLARGLFHRLEQLLVLDLSGNQLSSSHVDAGTFTGLIRLIVLNLSHNSLTRIDGRTFKDLFFLQILDLRNNSIGLIEDNAFLPLYNLHTLNLAENRLHTIGPHLFNGLFVLTKLTLNNNLVEHIDTLAFRNCSDLKELDLSSNGLTEVPEALKELSFLKTLDLGENQISDFRNGSFKNLQQLTGLRLIDNNIGNLTRGMLWDLPSLQVLNLAKNKIQSIERGTFERNTQIEAIRLDENFLTDINGIFATLASLLWLNLSDNHLVWFDYAFIPSNLKWLDIHNNFIEHLANYYKIQDEINVTTLDASHNRITEISPMSIPNSVELLFINNNFIKNVQANTFLDKAHLARVDMYANELVHLDLNGLRLAPVPLNRSLPEFYIGGNPFHCDCSMEWLQMINNMTGLRQHPRVMDLDNIMCRMTYSHGGITHMPLVEAKPSDFLCKYETHCFALCHCCDFDACDCEMTCPQNCTCYHDQTWSTNVVDCSGQNVNEIPHRIPMDATELYLDGNDFRELQNHVFIGRKNMRVLYVNNSGIETIQNRTFNGLNMLQFLHLEDNRIAELKGFEFEHLAHLKELYLQNNFIQYIGNMTLAPLRSLQILRLDGNRLTTFPIWQLSLNTHLQSIQIGNNQWSCRCKFLQELTVWVSDNQAKINDVSDIWCYNTDSKPPYKREINLNDTACSDFYSGNSVIESMLISDYLPMMVISLTLFLILLVLLVLMFVFRETVRVWLYSRYGVRLCHFTAQGNKHCAEDRDKLYDGYVCYSPKDEEFVVRSIAAELETGSPALQLCLHHRDLPAVVPQAYLQPATAVLEAAEASRRVLLILSRNFLQTEWSRFELRQALHEALKGRVFKLVVIEETSPLPEAELDPELRPYLKTAARVRWGDKRFWERLRYAMPNGHHHHHHTHHHTNSTRSSKSSHHHHNHTNYRTNINNYTIDSSVGITNGGHMMGTHHTTMMYPEKLKPAPQTPALHAHISSHPLFRAAQSCDVNTTNAAPPAYTSNNSLQRTDHDEANYSSATTATPSPRPQRRPLQHPVQQTLSGVNNNNSEQRPLSDHIYSSIDSDYSTLERGGSGRRIPTGHHPHSVVNSTIHNPGGHPVQAYLV